MANQNLSNAKKAKNDEFYTQYHDIEKEISAYLEYNPDVFKWKTILLPCDDPEWSNFTKFFAQNFETFGLKKIISTSFASKSKNYDNNYQATLFEINDEKFDQNKTTQNWKIFTLTRDITGDGRIDFKDLEWEYLQGDWDFNSDEIKALRDEADFIITNPPFSLFREFINWIFDKNKNFIVIWTVNSIIYTEVFPYIKANKMWLWNGFQSGNAFFNSPNNQNYADWVYDSESGLVKFRNCVWFTNIDHGRRHENLTLMSMSDHRKFNTKIQKNTNSYRKYDNYDAIEVPYTNAIPSDYTWVMWIPVNFLDKYNPDQFEIIWSNRWVWQDKDWIYWKSSYIDWKETYKRLFIKHKK